MFENYTPTQLVLIDTETNGLDRGKHEAVEVAWRNYQTGESGVFVPPHNVAQVMTRAAVNPRALQINGYIERGLWNPAGWDVDGVELVRLWEQFVGPATAEPDPFPQRIFMSVNPGFDAHFITKLFAADDERCDLNPTPWDYHLRDLGSYAAGVLGLPHDHPPLGSRDICEILGVTPGAHTAADDVRALYDCVHALHEIAEAVTDGEFDVICDCGCGQAKAEADVIAFAELT